MLPFFSVLSGLKRLSLFSMSRTFSLSLFWLNEHQRHQHYLACFNFTHVGEKGNLLVVYLLFLNFAWPLVLSCLTIDDTMMFAAKFFFFYLLLVLIS